MATDGFRVAPMFRERRTERWSTSLTYPVVSEDGRRGMLSAVTNCSWNSWIRDLVPQHILGRFLSRRLALATMVAMVFGLGAALFVDWWKGHASGESQALGYTFPLLLGGITLGMATPIFMSLMPEPQMQPPTGPQPSLLSTVATPLLSV